MDIFQTKNPRKKKKENKPRIGGLKLYNRGQDQEPPTNKEPPKQTLFLGHLAYHDECIDSFIS